MALARPLPLGYAPGTHLRVCAARLSALRRRHAHHRLRHRRRFGKPNTEHVGEPAQPPRIAPARGPPAREAEAESLPLADPIAQPEPDFQFDQTLSWGSEAGNRIKPPSASPGGCSLLRCARPSRRLHTQYRHRISSTCPFRPICLHSEALSRPIPALDARLHLISKVFQPTRGSGRDPVLRPRESAKFATHGRQIPVSAPLLRWSLVVAEASC